MTVLEQREAYAQLEPVWSGRLERMGEAPGLSAYSGRSSVYHSPSWSESEASEAVLTPRTAGQRGADKKPRIKAGSKDAEVLAKLKLGGSYNSIAKALDVSATVVRSVARRYGFDRRAMIGTNQYKASA